MAFKRHITFILPGLLAAGGIALGAQSLAAHPHTKPKKKPVAKTAPVTPDVAAPSDAASDSESTRIIRRMVKPDEASSSAPDIEIVEQIEIIEDASGEMDVRVIIVDGQPQLQLPTAQEQPEAETMKRHKRIEKRIRTADGEVETESKTPQTVKVIKKRIRIVDDGQPQVDENGMRVIKLTGETIVKVGDDGQLEIYNNGRMIEPMSFAPAEQGNMQTQVEDGGENMTLSVKKTVSDGDEGRKIRVEIDMETLNE